MPSKKFDTLGALGAAEGFWQERVASADISDHPTSKGNVAEAAWRDLLDRYLPARYRVSAGFVISADGRISDQVDCVVYDNVYTPTFFGEHGLCYIPAEAVYAVFEVKQTVTPSHIKYAVEKAESVRALHRTTDAYVGDGEIKSPKLLFPIIAGLMARKVEGKNGWQGEGVSKALDDMHRPVPGNPPKLLDVILTTESGTVDYFETAGNPDPSPEASIPRPRVHESGNGGLMIGILCLVQALQKRGTVSAIKWEDWLSRLKP